MDIIIKSWVVDGGLFRGLLRSVMIWVFVIWLTHPKKKLGKF